MVRNGCYTTGLQDHGQDSDPAIPPIGATESLEEARSRVCAQCRAAGAPLIANLPGHQGGAPEGWPPLATRAPALTLLAGARMVVRGDAMRGGADVARRAKGRQPAPSRARFPSDGDLIRAGAAPCCGQRSQVRRSPRSAACPPRRAQRALEVVCRASPHRPAYACPRLRLSSLDSIIGLVRGDGQRRSAFCNGLAGPACFY
jgi:hypothetical protein